MIVNKKYILKITNVIILFSSVFGEDIQFYPSQSLLNIKTKSHKIEFKNKYSKLINNENKINKVEIKTLRENKEKRAVDPVFHGHPKTREELWEAHFLTKTTAFDQTPSLIKLLNNITITYLKDCTPVILYDNYVEFKEGYMLQNLFKTFPVSYLHGRINNDDVVDEPRMLIPTERCINFIVFLADVKRVANVIGLQALSKVVVVARSSQWAVQEFLESKYSRSFVNLLVIGQTFKDNDESLVLF